MFRIKAALLAYAAVFALSALAATSATAATSGWMVNGALLTGSKALATTAAVDEFGKLKASGVTIECKGNTLNGVAPEIIASNKGAVQSLEFTGCKSITANCTVSPEKISTVPLSVEVTLEGALGVKATFTPKTKTLFATIKYEGELCALTGVQPVTGKATVSGPTGQDENTLQLLVANVLESTNELKVGSSAAELKGKALLKLASGEPWSFL